MGFRFKRTTMTLIDLEGQVCINNTITSNHKVIVRVRNGRLMSAIYIFIYLLAL